ncbi:MAG: LuxR family transcriptional regulator [Pseudomonadota bacterium]
MESIERFSTLLECRNELDLRAMLFQLGDDYGYEQVLLALVPTRHTPLYEATVHTNYSAEWMRTYMAAKLFDIDPTVHHSYRQSIPLIWKSRLFSSEAQKEMYEAACQYGLGNGLTLPFHGANSELGLLCFVSSRQSEAQFHHDAMHNMPDLSLLRDFAFEAMLTLTQKTAGQHEPAPAVTSRELQCLKWSAAGKTSWEIGHILHCSEATINFHFGNIRRKFNTATRRQAVVKAINWGLIGPS